MEAVIEFLGAHLGAVNGRLRAPLDLAVVEVEEVA